jgi:hypothetical protein
MGDAEAGLLPGERLLWTGWPARARVMPGDLALPGLLLAVLLVWVAEFGIGVVVNAPGGLALVALWAVPVLAVLIAAIAVVVRALRVKPAELRRTVYQVTDRRVLITTAPGHTWAAFLDQLAEPMVVPRRDGTADLSLREKEKFSLSTLNRWWQLQFTPGARQPFPVLRGLPDAELARQAISAGRARMLRGVLDVPPVPVPPGSTLHVGFVPAPGEQIVWTGRPRTTPWWFGTADIVCSANTAVFGAVSVTASGFVVSAAVSNGAPLPLLVGLLAVVVAGIGYPAVGRVLLRHARIKRSVYILTSWRLITTWGANRRRAGTQCPLAQLLPPQVKDGSVFTDLAWPPPATRQDSWARLMWPAVSIDPPQLIGLPDPWTVADLISSAQLAERARIWQLTNPHVHGNEWPAR